MLPTLAALEKAAGQVNAVLPPTPQIRWPLLCQQLGLEVWVKHENHTPVGSFKIRGGLVYLYDLKRSQPRVDGVVCATRGNHGQSVAFAARRLGLTPVVVVPLCNSPEKNAAMRALGAELILHGADLGEASAHAKALAAERGLWPVPSYDPLLVAGVGTYSLEFLRARPDLDVVYVPIGLGSGICGMIAAREALGHKAAIVGVVSAEAPAYARSFAAGTVVSCPAATSICDGLAVPTPHPHALALIRHHVDRIVEVTDAEVMAAMRALFFQTHNVAEGAGAAGYAAVVQELPVLKGRTVGIVMCGGNVDTHVFARVLSAAAPDPAASPDLGYRL